jgi:hypothetical protein
MRYHQKADELEWESDTQVLWGETHTSAYVSIRQHQKADELEWESDTQVLWGETLPELACYLHL